MRQPSPSLNVIDEFMKVPRVVPTIATARQHLPEVVGLAAREPQLVYVETSWWPRWSVRISPRRP
jgi:hypothetical protein